MDDILKIKKLTFGHTIDLLFEDLNLTLKYNEWYTLVGPNKVGKTTLVKIICGLIESQGDIEFNFLTLNNKNLKEIRTRLSVLFSNIDKQIIEDNVYDEIIFELKNMNLSSLEIENRIKKIAEIIDIEPIIYKDIAELNDYEKYLVVLTSALIIKPKLLIIDQTFDNLSKSERNKLYDIISKYREIHKLTILNITSNLEDSLLGDNIVVLESGKIIANDKIMNIFNNKILNEKNSKLPFVVELSEYLKLYELVDKKTEIVNLRLLSLYPLILLIFQRFLAI